MFDLHGKHALVCGSTQGIGRAAGLALAQAGAAVTLFARNESELQRVVRELDAISLADPSAIRPHHDYLVADFSEPERVRTVAGQYIAQSGPIHVLVNNTGGPPGGPALDAKPAEFVSAFGNHLLCNHHLVQVIVPGMRAAHYGRIINVISTSVKQPIKGLGVSNTIRGSVASWSKTLATELAPFGITVNNVLPGATVTGRHRALVQARAAKTGSTVEQIEAAIKTEIPAGRFADASEIAAAVLFLASAEAGYITGINLPVDGGRTGSL